MILRKLTVDDLSFLLEVRNDESTRKFLENDSVFTYDDCKSWFESNNPLWFIIEIDEESVGYIRTNGDEVGCDIHPTHRRKGYAKMAYKEYLKDKKYATLWVFVDNFAKKLYESLGFKSNSIEKTVRGRTYVQMVYNIPMDIKNNPIEFYIEKINNKDNFSFTRWGDGEWFCAVGKNGQNCDGHKYFPEMSKSLNTALNNDKGYYKAIWNLDHGQIKNILPTLLPFIKSNNIDLKWVNAGIWEDAALSGQLSPLVKSLESRNFVIVSSDKLKKIDIKYTDFVSVPPVNCFLDKERIKIDMIKMTEKYDDVVFGLSSSMATNVIVDELYDLIGNKCTMIDFGSIWDPFVGHIGRSYHKEYKNLKL